MKTVLALKGLAWTSIYAVTNPIQLYYRVPLAVLTERRYFERPYESLSLLVKSRPGRMRILSFSCTAQYSYSDISHTFVKLARLFPHGVLTTTSHFCCKP
jgi:hypothetical protein